MILSISSLPLSAGKRGNNISSNLYDREARRTQAVSKHTQHNECHDDVASVPLQRKRKNGKGNTRHRSCDEQENSKLDDAPVAH
jgi:hypothetical protein